MRICSFASLHHLVAVTHDGNSVAVYPCVMLRKRSVYSHEHFVYFKNSEHAKRVYNTLVGGKYFILNARAEFEKLCVRIVIRVGFSFKMLFQ